MSRGHAVALLMTVLLVPGCGASSGGTAAPSAAPPGPAAASASPGPSSKAAPTDDYQAALQAHSCYKASLDAANDPIKLAVPCDSAPAAFRLSSIQPASAGDCPPNRVLVSEKQKSADAVAPTLCLEPVTH